MTPRNHDEETTHTPSHNGTPVLTNEAVDWLEDDLIDLKQAAALVGLGKSR